MTNEEYVRLFEIALTVPTYRANRKSQLEQEIDFQLMRRGLIHHELTGGFCMSSITPKGFALLKFKIAGLTVT